MSERDKKAVLKEFREIPGVGPSLAQDLYDLDYRSIDELKGKNAEDMYEELVIRQGRPIDRCVLYVFREAVYYADNDTHDPELLKWWNWKDR